MTSSTSLGTIRLAISLVYSAGRRLLLVILASSIVTSLAIAGQLLVGRSLLDLIAGDDHSDAGELAPYLAVLGVLLLLAALSQAVASELRVLLGEQVDAAGDGRDPRRRHRGRARGVRGRRVPRPPAAGEARRRRTVVGGRVRPRHDRVDARRDDRRGRVLLTVAPVLVPIAVLGYVPIALVNVRNNRARYQLESEQTELQRDRSYLEYLMTDRIEAKEIRALRRRADAAHVARRARGTRA